MIDNRKVIPIDKLCELCKRFPKRSYELCTSCRIHVNRIYIHLESPLKKCECLSECDEMIHSLNMDGKPQRFKHGHQNRGHLSAHWKGKTVIQNSYEAILDPNRFNKSRKNKTRYIYNHRLIYERYYNCCLLPFTDIDHINMNKLDNRIENLRPMYKDQHARYHNISTKIYKKKEIKNYSSIAR